MDEEGEKNEKNFTVLYGRNVNKPNGNKDEGVSRKTQY